MVAGDVGWWRTASHKFLIRRSHLSSLAQLSILSRSILMFSLVILRGRARRILEQRWRRAARMPIITFWFARLSVEGSENSLAWLSATDWLVRLPTRATFLAQPVGDSWTLRFDGNVLTRGTGRIDMVAVVRADRGMAVSDESPFGSVRRRNSWLKQASFLWICRADPRPLPSVSVP